MVEPDPFAGPEQRGADGDTAPEFVRTVASRALEALDGPAPGFDLQQRIGFGQ